MVVIDDAFLQKLRDSLNDASSESEASSVNTSYWAIDKDEPIYYDECSHESVRFTTQETQHQQGFSMCACKTNQEPTIEDLKSQAFAKIVRLVSVRERCAYELKQRLIRDGFDHDIAVSCVQRACDCGLVDDLRFADVFIRSKISQGKGKAGIIRDLKMYGIDVHDVDGWPERFFSQDTYDAELERALAFLERKPPHSKNPMRSAYQKLISRGYDSSVAQLAAKEFVRQCRLPHE